MDATSSALQSASFSTVDCRDGQGASAWREIFGRAVVKIDITPMSEAFRARAAMVRWPGFGAIYAATSAVHQANSRELIASDDLSFGMVSFMAGPSIRWGASQLGWSADLRPGDGVLLSNADVGSITLPSDCRYTTFCIPRAVIKPLVSDMEAWFARRIAGTNPELKMLLSYLQLARNDQSLATPELRSAFANHVVDLLVLSLGATRDALERARMGGVRAARLHAMKQDIRAALGRADLSVRLIAEWHKVSPRYVQMLFDESGATFTRFVLEQRLAAAYRNLTDAAREKVPISTIAYEAGFSDLSNFNRVFRRRFGCTPSDVRTASRDSGVHSG